MSLMWDYKISFYNLSQNKDVPLMATGTRLWVTLYSEKLAM